MYSLCIKTTDNKIIDFSNSFFENIKFNTIYFCDKDFKLYKNFIIHYRPYYNSRDSLEDFFKLISNYIYDIIISFYEFPIIYTQFKNLFFYFDESEKNLLLDNCLDSVNFIDNIQKKKDILFPLIYDYISTNKAIYLDGFINFRIKPYIDFINNLINNCVNDYVVEKEYVEYIKLLKTYVNSRPSQTNILHLIYIKDDTILLDENLEILSITNNIQPSIISDISFNANDYILNMLISLLPKKLYIHLLSKEDEFISSLIKIFENTVHICSDCSICQAYQSLSYNPESNKKK